ncbi:hypothetical protein [Dehalobacter sp.]|nr:hypothetical protein [Dehalobacter sp.]MCG1024986.1 hypothetical protein [Dehalobacter sp.]
MPFLKGGASMYFTEGRLRAYESMMQKKPKQGHEPPDKPVSDEACKQYRYSDRPSEKCGKEKHVIPDD